MLIVLIIIAGLLLWLVRIGYKVCSNQVTATVRQEAKTDELIRAINYLNK